MYGTLKKYFLLLSLLSAFAFGNTGNIRSAAPVVASHELVFGVPTLPHDDLDQVHEPDVSGGQIAFQKNILAADLVQGSSWYHPHASFENYRIKASSLLIKDYLSHNYPSHNFW
ncbi:MAG TPA: hypothetical protein VMZ03_13000 [Chitinophagaceae bacterium]|nr:hypothetical protein [Chitinophagaceae bacterium]